MDADAPSHETDPSISQAPPCRLAGKKYESSKNEFSKKYESSKNESSKKYESVQYEILVQ
jgi:hypothetical protein